MTTNTEALREQFELYVNPEGDIKLHRLVDGSYAGHGLNQSWMDFQAGHAAGVAAERERGEVGIMLERDLRSNDQHNRPASAGPG